MRRLSTLVAALGTVFAMSSAQALIVVVDDFNTPDLQVIDQAGGGATVAGDAVRTLSHELLLGTNTATGNGSVVTIGSQTFPVGALEVANASGRNSEVKVSWNLGANLVPLLGSVSFLFQVIQSDGNPTNVNFLFSNGGPAISLQAFAIPGNTINQNLAFGLTGAEQILLNGGGTLTMVVNGATGWDMTLDSFGFEIPEPASLALVGMALLGAGVASRRRKA